MRGSRRAFDHGSNVRLPEYESRKGTIVARLALSSSLLDTTLESKTIGRPEENDFDANDPKSKGRHYDLSSISVRQLRIFLRTFCFQKLTIPLPKIETMLGGQLRIHFAFR